MQTIEIRPIFTQEELAECLDLWAAVFPENRTFFEERLNHDPACYREHTWFAKVNGEIAAAVQLFPYYTYLEGVPIKVGGIGSVATLPKYRGRRLTHLILQRQSEWMKRQGFDLSLLFTGIHSFYEKVGWTTLPISGYQVVCLELRERLESQQTGSYLVIPYSSDFQEGVQDVYKQFSESFFGPTRRTTDYWLGQLKWRKEKLEDFWVATASNRVVGYLRVKSSPHTYLEITECCYLQGYEEVVSGLLLAALKSHPDAAQLTVTVPKSHAVFQLLNKTRISIKETFETHEMWKIIHTPSFLRKLESVLMKRFEEIDEPGLKRKLLFSLENEEFLVSIDNGIVEISDPGSCFTYQTLYKRRLSDFLIDLIYGTSEMDPILQTLFPKRDYLDWQTDHF